MSFSEGYLFLKYSDNERNVISLFKPLLETFKFKKVNKYIYKWTWKLQNKCALLLIHDPRHH